MPGSKSSTRLKGLFARTKLLFEQEGYLHFDSTESYSSFSRKKKDLFGIFDAVAVGERIIGVQITSRSNHSTRRKKIFVENKAVADGWIAAGGVIVIVSWSKKGNRYDCKKETFG